MLLKVLAGLCGTINLGIGTAFLLAKPVSYFELGIVYSLNLFVSLVFDFPTGNLADLLGRKKVFGLGIAAIAVQYLLFAGFRAVPVLYLASSLGGVGDAMIGGSLEAWLGEEERRRTPTPKLHRVFGLTRSLTNLVSIAGSLAIGVLLKANLALIYWVAAGLMGLASLLALTILPDNRGAGRGATHFTVATIKAFARSPVQVFLSLVLAGSFAAYSVFVMYWQPQALAYGMTPTRLPLLYTASLAAAALSSYLYAILARRVGSGRFVYAAYLALAVGFGFMVFGPGLPWLGAGLFCFGLGWGSVFPLFYDWASDVVPSDLRASALSLMHAVAMVVATLTTTGVGKVIEVWGLAGAARIGLGIGVGALILLGLSWKLAAAWEAGRGVEAAAGGSGGGTGGGNGGGME